VLRPRVQLSAYNCSTKGTDGKYIDYNACCDMWGLGLCLHFMAFGKLPWKATRNQIQELEEEITSSRIQFPTHIRRSQDILQLIRLLLVRDPNIRPTSRDLLLSIPVQNLVKKVNDPQFDNLNAEIVVQGPHTRTFAERKFKNLSSTIPLLPPSNPTTPERSLNNSQKKFKLPTLINKDKRLLFLILSFFYFTLKIFSSSILFGAEIPANIPYYSLVAQFLSGLSLFLFKRISHTYLFFVYNLELIWCLLAILQMDNMTTQHKFFAFICELVILVLGFLLLYGDYICHRNISMRRRK